MLQFEKQLHPPARWFNWIAAIAVTAMMMLTCVDVLLRILRCPIPGTYEIVGLLGATFVSFSLAHTTTEGGHIAVDFLIRKLSSGKQALIECINSIICAILFAVITWHSIAYALDLKNSGEVSMTLQMPIHPFVFGIALGCGMLCLVLLFRFVDLIINVVKAANGYD